MSPSVSPDSLCPSLPGPRKCKVAGAGRATSSLPHPKSDGTTGKMELWIESLGRQHHERGTPVLGLQTLTPPHTTKPTSGSSSPPCTCMHTQLCAIHRYSLQTVMLKIQQPSAGQWRGLAWGTCSPPTSGTLTRTASTLPPLVHPRGQEQTGLPEPNAT